MNSTIVIRRPLLPAILALLGSILMTGCDVGVETTAKIPAKKDAAATKSATPPSATSTQKLKIGFMPKIDIPYFQACRKGAEEAAKGHGADFDYFGGAELKVAQQISRIDEWVAQGYDVIVLAPNDPEQICPAIKRAKDAGVVVVTYDADANPQKSKRDAFVNQASTQGIGEMMVDIVGKAIGGEGQCLIVSSTPTAPNQNAWMAVMKPKLKKDYPKIELLTDLMPGEDQTMCREQTLQAIHANPNLKAIWGLTSKALPGAAEAVKQAGKAGKIKVTGLGLPSELEPFVKDGTVEQFVLWSPVDLGYLAVEVGVALKKGEFSVEKSEFGRLKGIKTTGTEVLLGPPKIYDKSNVSGAGF